MTVSLSPRKKEKILKIIETKQWLLPQKTAELKEIAGIVGLLESASEYFPWGRAQLSIIYDHLGTCIKNAYANSHARKRARAEYATAKSVLPRNMEYRLQHLCASYISRHIWRCKTKIQITNHTRASLEIIYKYIQSSQPWEMPIGHIVPRVPHFTATTDASTKAIGIDIPCIQTWCMIPYSAATYARVVANEIHINTLEFIGILVAYIITLEHYRAHSHLYPPSPTLHAYGDNTSANAWWTKSSTSSPMGRNLVRLYAEYKLLAPVHSTIAHIKGEANVVADTISRPDNLFIPKLTEIHSTSYPTLIHQITTHFKPKTHWHLFLPSPELLSCLKSALSAEYSPTRPKKPQNSGQFVRAESISSCSSTPNTCSAAYFL